MTPKNPAAVSLGKLRMAKMTAQEREEWAKSGREARWAGKSPKARREALKAANEARHMNAEIKRKSKVEKKD